LHFEDITSFGVHYQDFELPKGSELVYYLPPLLHKRLSCKELMSWEILEGFSIEPMKPGVKYRVYNEIKRFK